MTCCKTLESSPISYDISSKQACSRFLITEHLKISEGRYLGPLHGIPYGLKNIIAMTS